ncbi:MAG: tetratricopeptide repeat protein [Bacteroidota bacterium]
MQKIAAAFVSALILVNSCFAQSMVDSLLKELRKPVDDTNKVIVYRMLTGIVKNTEPVKAVEYGKAGVAIGKKLKWEKGVAGCYLNIAAAYNDALKLDSAILYIDSAITWSHKAGDPNRLALAYLNRADFNMQLRNLKKTLLDCDTALLYAEKADNNDRRARILQTIGSVYYLQEKYQESKDYYNRATALYKQAGNLKMAAIAINNIGNIYKHTGEYQLAISHFKTSIHLADSLQDLVNMSMYYGNLSDVYTENRQFEFAEQAATLSLKYASEQDNQLRIAMAYTNFGQLYLEQKRYDLAIKAADNSFKLSKQESDIETQYNAASILADAYAGSGNHQQAYDYVLISKQLNDSLLKMKYDEDIAALQTNFKVEEKNKQILLLNSVKELQHQQLLEQRVLLFSSAAIALLLLAAIALMVNRYRLNQHLKEMKIRNQIAADLHDEVGSSLSSIHMLSQMAATKPTSDISQQKILARMSVHAKETMDKMGDIVWMIKPGENEAINLKQRMEHYAYEICSSQNIDATIDLDEIEKWKLSMDKRKNIYLVFKEAVNNAVKYSGSQNLRVNASSNSKQLQLVVEDFGHGFNTGNIARGNGLDNMQNRAKDMNGSLDISSSGKGTIIKLVVPV